MADEDFEITRDEYNFTYISDFMKQISLGKRMFQSEMYGDWHKKQEEEPDWRCQTASPEPKNIPVCADSDREKNLIIQRLAEVWIDRPDLSLGQLISMPFLRLEALASLGDYDLIRAIESAKSADYSPCRSQKDLSLLQALKRAAAGLDATSDALERMITLLEEGE